MEDHDTPKAEPASPGTYWETEAIALQTALRRTEEMVSSKDRELAAKEEIIALLREKIARLEQISVPAASRRENKQSPGEPGEVSPGKNAEPISTWEQIKDWFFNA